MAAAGSTVFNPVDRILKNWVVPDRVVATACTAGGFWEDDPEEKIKNQVEGLKRKFHCGRQLLIKYLPRDVTEEDVRELLADFPVQLVVLQTGSGSGSARVTLEDPEMLEEWDRDRVFVLRGQRVPVAPAPTEMMLCVARLPSAFTRPQFEALVRSYGEVRRSFLMISERTGLSKGYGFVEYGVKETAMQAKSLLDGRQLDGCTLCCDWLDSGHVTFESLHSKCLYVDRLPPNFRDMGEFRKVFSSVVNPPYCQIALRNGCPQDWGLVEFSTADDAELTRAAVERVQLRGHKIRSAFYIPGVRAINLYLKLLNESAGNKSKGAALLPDPPAPAVFQQLQNLAKQNPIFAQNLQNIILNQIQNTHPDTAKSSAAGSSSTPPPPPDSSQAALVVLLAAQMQSQMGSNSPSLLGNPQMLATLQNLLKQSSPPDDKNNQTTKVPLLPSPSREVSPPPQPVWSAPPPKQKTDLGLINPLALLGLPFQPASAPWVPPPPPVAVRPCWSPVVFAPGLWATPVTPPVGAGQKRKYNHILPSPEPSPEGNYIGQHSQGLGGHYADSYFKRKKPKY